MTRINANIAPEKLTDQHLLAELRELPRVFTLSAKHTHTDIPEKFTLGKGHVKFFYSKLSYLFIRYSKLCTEYEKRYDKDYSLWIPFAQSYGWVARTGGKLWDEREAGDVVKDRVTERLKTGKAKWRHYGKAVTPEQAVQLLG